jgi:hypothetical protein
MSNLTITKLYILIALRKAELTQGTGFAAKLEAGDVASGRILAVDGLVQLGRARAPASGTTVTLTDPGRRFVDGLARDRSAVSQAADDQPGGPV